VDRATFEAHQARDGFLETNEFLGSHFYGTPRPDPPPGRDLVLEIDVNGAEQVRAVHPEAVVIMVVPPSEEAQAERLRHRGDSPAQVEARLALGRDEVPRGRAVADHVVVNDDLDRAVEEVTGIIAGHRAEGA
jgi:guanylate kinase